VSANDVLLSWRVAVKVDVPVRVRTKEARILVIVLCRTSDLREPRAVSSNSFATVLVSRRIMYGHTFLCEDS
jgi:hypothetical protein